MLGDSRKLEALEEFLGQGYVGTWCWGEKDPNPHGAAAPMVLQAFDHLKDYVNTELLAQTHYKSYLENIALTYDSTAQAWQVENDVDSDVVWKIAA